jgi:hypothetical protein
VLKRLAIQLHIYEWAHIDLETARKRLKEAKRAYRINSANDENWRDDHIEALVEAPALASGKRVELEWKLMYEKKGKVTWHGFKTDKAETNERTCLSY